jgi:hypothetical protein
MYVTDPHCTQQQSAVTHCPTVVMFPVNTLMFSVQAWWLKHNLLGSEKSIYKLLIDVDITQYLHCSRKKLLLTSDFCLKENKKNIGILYVSRFISPLLFFSLPLFVNTLLWPSFSIHKNFGPILIKTLCVCSGTQLHFLVPWASNHNGRP